MIAPLIANRVRRSAGQFAGAEQANVAVLFAIALVPIISFVGAAIDYSRANRARSTMQAAMDSTALMLSKDLSSGAITAAQIPTKAQTYFTALYTDPESSPSVTATYNPTTGSGSSVVITGSGTIQTDFMKVVGFPTMTFNASSTTTWGNSRLRVALALDNTGSMQDNGKIGALRTAASNLVDQLSALSKKAGDVYISVIPFAKDVNVGSSNYGQNWIDWTDWEAEAPDLVGSSNKPRNWSSLGPGSSCPWSMRSDGFTCVNGPGSTTAISTIPSSGSNKGLICPGPDGNSGSYAYHYLINGCYTSVKSGSTYTHTWTPNAHSTWSGCVTDRTQPYDAQNTTPSSGTVATLFPAEQYFENGESYCVTNNSPPLQAVAPMTSDWSSLKTMINAMQPTGGTNQPIGLAWGWESLLLTGPIPAPAEDPSYTYNRIIILLSDGLNTEDRWPAYGDGSSQNGGQIDARQQLMCNNIKNAKDASGKLMYTIYTIQVNTSSPADPTSTVLQNCASDSSKFFMLTSANQIVTTFSQIGTQLSQLRVSQ